MSYRRLASMTVLVVVAVLSIAVAGQSLKTARAQEVDLAMLKAQVRLLLDKQEIHDVMARYARGVDRGDWELASSQYHADAVDDHGGGAVFIGPDIGKTRASNAGQGTGQRTADSVLLVGQQSAKRKQMGQHFVGNELIEVEGDTAYAEHYVMAHLIIERNGEEYTRTRADRYLDRLERRDGKWKIAYRVLVDDWDRLDKVVEAVPGASSWRRGDVREKDPFATFKSGAMREHEKALRAKLFAKPR